MPNSKGQTAALVVFRNCKLQLQINQAHVDDNETARRANREGYEVCRKYS